MSNIPYKTGGGSFVPYTEFTVVNIPTSTSGELISVTPAAGNIVRIASLTTGTASSEPNITVAIETNDGNKNILDDGVLANNNGGGNFIISNIGRSATGDVEQLLPHMDCKSFSVTKTVGSTATSVRVSYIEGRFE